MSTCLRIYRLGRVMARSFVGQQTGITHQPVTHQPVTHQHTGQSGSHNRRSSKIYLASAALIAAAAVQGDTSRERGVELHDAVMVEDIETVERLLKSGVDPNTRHVLGWCPLHAAAAQSNARLVELLLRYGADPNLGDHFTTPSQVSRATQTKLNVVHRERREMNSNFQLNCNYEGMTALHYAVLEDSVDIVRILVDNGAQVEVYSAHHNITPLDCTNDEDIRTILEHGAARQRKLHASGLGDHLRSTLIGQIPAIEAVTSAVLRRDMGWGEERPLVMMFVGSSGIGKTELAKQLAKYREKKTRNGGETSFIRIDMSEFQDKHEVSKFIGAPPGYVGYDEGGQLTKALTKCPDAVVLFDEVEKAHPDVLNIMLQLFDEGRLTDGKGQTTLCPNAVFILTSNVGADQIGYYGYCGSEAIDDDFKSSVMYPLLKSAFKRNEFLGRINEIVYFLPFSEEQCVEFVEWELGAVKERAEKLGIYFSWTTDAAKRLADAFDNHYGARSLKNEVGRKVLNKIADLNLSEKIKTGSNVVLNCGDDGLELDIS